MLIIYWKSWAIWKFYCLKLKILAHQFGCQSKRKLNIRASFISVVHFSENCKISKLTSWADFVLTGVNENLIASPSVSKCNILHWPKHFSSSQTKHWKQRSKAKWASIVKFVILKLWFWTPKQIKVLDLLILIFSVWFRSAVCSLNRFVT